jgi:ADP-ribose pyrophosphatase YjhB (NUDIX family)
MDIEPYETNPTLNADPTIHSIMINLPREMSWGSPEQPFWYPGPNPTVDLVLLCREELLLVRRRDKKGVAERGRLALPGGFHDTLSEQGLPWLPGKESARSAALRELSEETGLDLVSLEENLHYVGFYSERDRDPRNNQWAWAVSNAYLLKLPDDLILPKPVGLDDVEGADWFSLKKLDLSELAFDHEQIVTDALALSV